MNFPGAAAHQAVLMSIPSANIGSLRDRPKNRAPLPQRPVLTFRIESTFFGLLRYQWFRYQWLLRPSLTLVEEFI